jgi:tetratricopeptide (TPR) repeat protein
MARFESVGTRTDHSGQRRSIAVRLKCLRLSRSLFAVFLILAVFFVTHSARADAIEDCNSDDVTAALRGCDTAIEQKLLTGSDLAIAYSRRSDIFASLGNPEKALFDLEKAVSLAPDDSVLRSRLLSAFAATANKQRGSKNIKAALSTYRRGFNADPTNAQFVAGFVETVISVENPSGAIAETKSWTELGANLEKLHVAIMSAFVDRARQELLVDHAQSAEALLGAIKGLSNLPAEVPRLAGMAFAVQDKSQQAIGEFTSFIAADTRNAEGYVLRAEQYRKLNAKSDAIADCDSALRIDPKLTAALMLRGLLSEESGNRQAAIGDYESVVAIDSTDVIAKKALERMKQVEPPKSIAISLSEDDRARLTRFVIEMYVNAGVAGSYHLKPSHADRVTYFGKVRERAKIEKEKKEYYAVWPKRHYAVRPDTLSISRLPDGKHYGVKYEYDFSVENDKKEVSGTGRTELTLVDQSGSFAITSENGSVLHREIVEHEDPNSVNGMITSYDCGDNCYLTIIDGSGQEHIGLCIAKLCQSWNEKAEMPRRFLKQRVRVVVGIGKKLVGEELEDGTAFKEIVLVK